MSLSVSPESSLSHSMDVCLKDEPQAKETGKILITFIEKAISSLQKDYKKVKELIQDAFQKLQSMGQTKKLSKKAIKVIPLQNQRQSRLVGKISNDVLNVILSFAIKYDTESLQDSNIFSTCKYFQALEKPFIERTGKGKMVEAIVRNLLLQKKAPSPQAFKFPNLTITHLSLEGNRGISLIEPMMQKIVKCFPDLTELNLKNSFLNLKKGCIKVFGDGEYKSPDGYCLDRARGDILPPLAELKNLRVLNLDDNRELSHELSSISRHGLIVDPGNVFPKLESLSFLNGSFAMRPILNALAVGKLMPSLTSLSCSKTKIDEHESDWRGMLQPIEWALGELRLKVLHLANHPVYSYSLDLLLNNARFERLELVNCNLSADSLGRLVKIPTLQYLNVRNNRDLREEDIAKAKEENPQLMIEG